MALAQQIKWKEVYASVALNRKLSGVILPGIYRGFFVSPHSGMTVAVSPNVAQHPLSVAVVERGGFNFTVTSDAVEEFTIPNGTEGQFFLCLDAQYISGGGGFQDLVLVAESSVAGHHVVLARLTIPSGTTEITADMISEHGRTMAITNSNRNHILNGCFRVWQRGTSQTTSGYGSADRWASYNMGTTKTASWQEFSPGQMEVPGSPKAYMRHVVSSVIGPSHSCSVEQKIEGVQTLAGQKATLSFWARADAVKNIAVGFVQSFGTGGSPSAPVGAIGSQLVGLTSAWHKYTITVDIPSIAEKTLGTDNNDYLNLVFWFDAGSGYNSAAANLGQQSGTFDIAQVQLEEGEIATLFEDRSIAAEFALCQRYYVGGLASCGSGYATAVGQNARCQVNFQYPVIMRAVPTKTITTSVSGSVDGLGINPSHDTTKNYTLSFISTASGSLYWAGLLNADAEL